MFILYTIFSQKMLRIPPPVLFFTMELVNEQNNRQKSNTNTDYLYNWTGIDKCLIISKIPLREI